jgi:ABC-type multidrug transport system ATPase subunit
MISLELASVSKRFGHTDVLRQAWLQAADGEIVGLVGCNGAGKTTLLRIAAGLVRPDEGVVRWTSAPPIVRYFAGESTLPPDVRAFRWGGFFGALIDERRRIGRLSRGNRQLVGLRAVLAGAPAGVLLLDEPWDGLDPPAADWLSSVVRAWATAGAAVVISSHRLHDLDAVADRFVLLEGGRCQPLTSSAGGRLRHVADAVSRR